MTSTANVKAVETLRLPKQDMGKNRALLVGVGEGRVHHCFVIRKAFRGRGAGCSCKIQRSWSV